MRTLKTLSLLTLIFLYTTIGLILHFLINFTQPKLRYRIISDWTKVINRILRKFLGIKIFVEGNITYLKERGNFIIANHQSYLDGIVLASLFPVVFVSKLQVKSWPIFGWMTQVGGTIYVDRGKKSKSIDSLKEIADRLKNKINILLFPEGTSTDGSKILAFQSIFFQAPLNAGSPVVPITIQYLKIDSQNVSILNRDRLCWYGQIKFFKHLLDILKLKNIEVKVIIHPKIEMGVDSTRADFRKQLSQISRQIILKDFSFIK